MRAILSALQRAPSNSRRLFSSAGASTSAAVSLTKKTTGIVGLDVVPDAKAVLVRLYEKTLNDIRIIPSGVPYRVDVEAFTKYRLDVVRKHEDVRRQAAFKPAAGTAAKRGEHGLLPSVSIARPGFNSPHRLSLPGHPLDPLPPSRPARRLAQVLAIEKEIGCGQVEELIEDAKGELILIPQYASWKAWEKPRASPQDDEYAEFFEDLAAADPEAAGECRCCPLSFRCWAACVVVGAFWRWCAFDRGRRELLRRLREYPVSYGLSSLTAPPRPSLKLVTFFYPSIRTPSEPIACDCSERWRTRAL